MGERLEGGQVNNDFSFVCVSESEQTHMPRTKS